MPNNKQREDVHTERNGDWMAKIDGKGKTSQYYGNVKTGQHYTKHRDGSAHKHDGRGNKWSSSDGSFNDKD